MAPPHPCVASPSGQPGFGELITACQSNDRWLRLEVGNFSESANLHRRSNIGRLGPCAGLCALPV
jgi:hypothetical protein